MICKVENLHELYFHSYAALILSSTRGNNDAYIFYLICVAIFDLSLFVSSSSAVNSTIFAFFYFFFVIDGYYLHTINHASFYNLMHNVVIWFTLWFVTCVTLWGILIVIKKWSHFIYKEFALHLFPSNW